MEDVESSPSSALWDMGMCSAEKVSSVEVSAFGTTRMWFPENHDLRDAIAVAYGVSTYAVFSADALSMRKVDGSGEADGDVESLETKSSEDSDKSNSELSDFNLKMESTPE